MLLESRLQASLRLPFGEDVAKRFEAVKTQISGVGDGLADVVRPRNAGMAYLNIPFLFCGHGQRRGSCAQGSQLDQATTTYRSFQQANGTR
jgi:hypothetical protein